MMENSKMSNEVNISERNVVEIIILICISFFTAVLYNDFFTGILFFVVVFILVFFKDYYKEYLKEYLNVIMNFIKVESFTLNKPEVLYLFSLLTMFIGIIIIVDIGMAFLFLSAGFFINCIALIIE